MATVLVVDDLASDRALVGAFLRLDPTLEIREAADGSQALVLLEREPVDIVVTDLMMPEVDGLELVTEVRARRPLVPVILMTSEGSEEIAVQALRRGAASYVPKRRLAQDILATVRGVLGVAGQQRGRARLLGHLSQSNCAFELPNDCTLFEPLIGYLQESITQLGICDESDYTRISIALAEALSNAAFHGNLEIPSALRGDDEDAYCRMIDERLQKRPYCERRIHVVATMSREEARFVVRDEGPGFDPQSLPDPTDPANLEKLSGRGVLLMRSFMDELTYSPRGNEVTLVKRCNNTRS